MTRSVSSLLTTALLALTVLGAPACAVEDEVIADESLASEESELFAGPYMMCTHWACSEGGAYVCQLNPGCSAGWCVYNSHGLGGESEEEWFEASPGTILGANEGLGNWLPYCGTAY